MKSPSDSSHSWLSALAFVAAFVGVCAAISSRLPFPDVPIARPKIEHLARHHDDYDTLLLGSSRIAYQIIPSIFDAETTAHALPTRTFNAAIAGMNPPEDAYFLDTILRHPPRSLRWVVLELASLGTGVDRTRGTIRSVYWRDWERTALVFRRLLAPRIDSKKTGWKFTRQRLVEEWPRLLDFLEMWGERATNLGRGTPFTDRLLKPHAPAEETTFEDGGWVRADRPEPMAGSDLAEYQRELAERREKPAVEHSSDAVSQESLARMIGKIERLGARAVLVVPPTTSKRNFVPLPATMSRSLVLDFSDIEKFPELYRLEHRLDTDHLNTEGSKIFSRLIARRIAEESRAHP